MAQQQKPKSRAEYFRDYRRRKREQREAHDVALRSATVKPTVAPTPQPAKPMPQPAQPAPQPRRRRVKSDQQIRSFIAGTMRMHSHNPMAFLNLMVGYIAQLQDEMKRESEDSFAERNCAGRHPGKMSAGVYCRLCHDVEMAGKFGSIPGGQPLAELDPETSMGPDADLTLEEQLLLGITLKPPSE